MRFDLHLRREVADRLEQLADQMRAWEAQPRIDEDESKRICASIGFFDHCTRTDNLRIGGVDGSGDYPALAYADSFVNVTVAHGTVYASDDVRGLREQAISLDPIIEFTWTKYRSGHRSTRQHLATAIIEGLDDLAEQEIIDSANKFPTAAINEIDRLKTQLTVYSRKLINAADELIAWKNASGLKYEDDSDKIASNQTKKPKKPKKPKK